ncbi:MAG: hypothetical protein K2Y27_35120 [Xanthobacteraceae bacterium]|nr:hypothetical protein [Xanthobacteraceae bacterium]
MIQIVIRIIPNGDKKRAVEHGVAEVTRVAGDVVCDYSVSAGENQNPVAQALDWSARGHVLGHDRRQSVWALVAKVATWAASEAEKAAGQR